MDHASKGDTTETVVAGPEVVGAPLRHRRGTGSPEKGQRLAGQQGLREHQ